MNGTVVDVGFQYVYDLYYRVRNAMLQHSVYRLDFLDWVRAGVAYNTLGAKNAQRRISYFAKLYYGITSGRGTLSESELRRAITMYYEDLFQLYQDHLVAQLHQRGRASSGSSMEPEDLILLPSFHLMSDVFAGIPVEEVMLDNYVPQNIELMREQLATIYVSEEGTLYRGIGLVFDYGVMHQGDGIILEVK